MPGRRSVPALDHRPASRSRCVCSGSRADSSAAATPRRTASSAASSSSTTTCRPSCGTASTREPHTYRAWVRFSGPGPYVTPDIDDVGFMSISIKLMGVPGPKLMDEETVHPGHVRRLDADVRHARHQRQRAAAAREPEERADLLLRQPPSLARPRLHHAVAVDQDAEQPVRSAVLQLRALPARRGPGDAVFGLAEIDAADAGAAAAASVRPTTTCATPWSRRWREGTSSSTSACSGRPTRTCMPIENNARALARAAVASGLGGDAAAPAADVQFAGADGRSPGASPTTRGIRFLSIARSATRAGRAAGCTTSYRSSVTTMNAVPHYEPTGDEVFEYAMTPQSAFMVLAPIDPAARARLSRLLASMNDAPGCTGRQCARAVCTVRPGACRPVSHPGRQDPGRRRVHGTQTPSYPRDLAFLGEVDGEADAFLADVSARAPEGLRAIFACCEGFGAQTDLLDWVRAHQVAAAAAYVNWRGRTVRRVREDAALRDVLERHVRLRWPRNSSPWAPTRCTRGSAPSCSTMRRAGASRCLPRRRHRSGGRLANLLHLASLPSRSSRWPWCCLSRRACAAGRGHCPCRGGRPSSIFGENGPRTVRAPRPPTSRHWPSSRTTT